MKISQKVLILTGIIALVCLTTAHLQKWVQDYQSKNLRNIVENIQFLLPHLEEKLNVSALSPQKKKEQIVSLNHQIQPILESITNTNPSTIVGVYSKNLEAVVARAPFNKYGEQIGQPIPPDYPSQKVYRIGRPFFEISRNLNNNLVTKYYLPLIDDGEIVGHLVVMQPIWNYLDQLLNVVGQCILSIGLIIVLGSLWHNTYKKNVNNDLAVLQGHLASLKLERQIQRSDQLKIVGEIASNTAHEIRNPLTVMKGISQLGIITPEKQKKDQYFQSLIKEIDYLDNMLAQLILLAEPQDNSLQSMDLAKTFTNLLKLLQGKALLQEVDLDVDFPGELPRILGNPKMLQQAFLNLLSNALEAMPQGGKLTISADYLEAKENISLTIKDTGTGIAKENMGKLFTPFFTTKNNGTGLGLAITYKIITEDHGGSIQIESQEGAGTTVYLELPINQKGERV